ncbi:MAG: tryptophan--tRNA ligase [Candidatus Saccharibacteria bacterium]|nr:tryptophan--tRNA ligase [Candidatus Saccharibacteria bacterium]
MSKQVILTGIRANNDLTIGNYFGAIMPTIDMAATRADEFQVNLFVPDLHSFTTPIDHTKLHDQIWHNIRVFAAAGLPLDKPDIHIYRQSYIPAHSEMTWILDCFTGMGEMARMTQFKDKSGAATSDDEQSSSQDRVSVGLFNYPVLMAADILLYGATYVPVGDDQSQHLEFTRDIAERLNAKFGELFTVPKPVQEQHAFFGKDQGLRIKDLQDPTKKMSKSDDTGNGVIFLGDTPETAAKKIMSATTDSVGKVAYDPDKQPGVANLLQILALFSHRDLQEVIGEWEGKTMYGDLKKAVADACSQFLTTFQAKLASVDDNLLQAKLEASEAAMREQAGRTLLTVQQAVGLRPKGQ